MAAGFSIRIDADDRASKVLGNVQKNAIAVGKKLQAIGGKGISEADKQMALLARSGWEAARSITSAVEPLAILTGAGTLAGLVKLTTQWGQFGRTLGNTAVRLDVSTDSLQGLQGAAKLTGATADDMTSGLAGLQETLYGATNGTNATAIAWFKSLGIAFQDSTGHALKADQVFKQVATKIAAFKDPAAAAAVARTFGIPETLLPLMRKGGAGIDKLEDTATAYGGKLSPTDIRNAQAYAEAMAKLDLAGNNLAHMLGDALGPALTPILTNMASWVKDNQALIQADINDVVTRGVTAVTNFSTEIQHVVDAVGGWKKATEDIIELYLGVRFAGAVAAAASLRGAGVAAGAGGRVGKAANAATAVASIIPLAKVAVPVGLAAGYGASWIDSKFPALRELDNWTESLFGNTPKAIGAAPFSAAPAPPKDTNLPIGLDAPTLPQITAADFQKQAMDYFQTKGGGAWKHYQAAGIVAGLQSESGMSPFASGDHGHAFGLGQWQGPRQKDYAALFGHTMQSVTDKTAAISEQLGFVNYELEHGERAAGLKLRATTGAYASGDTASRFYERPAAVEEAARNRGNLALTLDGQAIPAGAPGVTPGGVVCP